MSAFERICSGIEGLDSALDSIRMGDNVVWQVSSIEEYGLFVKPYVRQAIADGRNLIYMRFAEHAPLAEKQPGLKTYFLDPAKGFESFTVEVHQIITQEGKEAFYLFDSLSGLQGAWAADLMMGNFFCVTCPYLFQMDTVAYFPIIRGKHSFDAIARIRDTTQILLDVYVNEQERYVHPLKVWNRYSSTMFLPHCFHGDGMLRPLVNEVGISKYYAARNRLADSGDDQNLDSWERFFALKRMRHAQDGLTAEDCRVMRKMIITHDGKMAELVERYFTPQDYFSVRNRMIGTGTVGGKACGMLVARKIVESCFPEYSGNMEPHDSFYIGSDVFYTYIVQNGGWGLRVRQRMEENYFTVADELGEKLRTGEFSGKIREQFRNMLEYFGQAPIIVRSSSFLEDGFGNAFAGKYESVFCVNKGSLEERLEKFEQAVRTVYASTMDPSALQYRKQRNLNKKDEQMAVLVQRVSGSHYDKYLFPNAAGVGYSYSAYQWQEGMDPSAGMLRLVMGLGTRAVDRTQGDYPRIASLDSPTASTLTSYAQKHRFSQHKVDVLDMEENALREKRIEELIPVMPQWYKNLVLEHDREAEESLRQRGQARDVYFVNCQELLENRKFTEMMKRILHALQTEYQCPVDIEYTFNANEDRDFVVNLLQCRPLQTAGEGQKVTFPDIREEDIWFEVREASMGTSRREKIDLVVLVDARGYYEFPYARKKDVAQAIGEINRQHKRQDRKMLLAVPGRIGTSSPELGVPATFADISEFCAICEFSESSAGYMPELSYGSHMFQDLVETDIFYAAIFESEKTKIFHKDFFAGLPSFFERLVPGHTELGNIIRVYDMGGENMELISDMMQGRTVCGIVEESKPNEG